MLVPLYLDHLGHSVEIIGLVIGFGGVATLAARLCMASLYRRDRARGLLVCTLAGGALSYALAPFMPDLVSFSVAFVANRACIGLAGGFFLARYLDLMAEGADRRRAMGYFGGTQAFGFMATHLLVGLLAEFVGYTHAFLWGAASALLAATLLTLAPNPRPRVIAPSSRGDATSASSPGVSGTVGDPGLWKAVNGAFWTQFLHLVLAAFFPLFALQLGMGPAQVGVTRAAFSAVNALSRPISALVMGRWSTRQLIALGLLVQAALLCAIPFFDSFEVFLALFLVSAAGGAIVVMASSTALAEEVDETRVKRGVATSTFSAAPEVAGISAPPIAGAVAAAAGIGPMFAILAVGSFAVFGLVDAYIAHARSRMGSTAPRARPSRG